MASVAKRRLAREAAKLKREWGVDGVYVSEAPVIQAAPAFHSTSSTRLTQT